MLLEAAAYPVWNAALEPSREQRQTMLPAALADLSSHGFSESHGLYAPAWLGPILANLDHQDKLSAAIHLFAPLDDPEGEFERSWSYTTSRVRLADTKLFADGTLNSRTTWMLRPYAKPIPGLPTARSLHLQRRSKPRLSEPRA